ncbi:MAG: hypothetical protein Q8Q14_03415 [Gemmatimonadales bacterium]|nr:hypothetical protein [Gemmatimonadales bacterium]
MPDRTTRIFDRVKAVFGVESALERERREQYEAARQRLVRMLAAGKLTELELQAQLQLLEGPNGVRTSSP